MENEKLVSPIKWAGGKTVLIPIIKEWIDTYIEENHIQNATYVDLFCGSLAIPLQLDIPNIIVNDINSSLIHMYRTIQKYPRELLLHLEILNTEEYNNTETFNEIKNQFNEDKMKNELSIEHAAHFIYLNRRSFNGLYRENQSGKYNVPYRKYISDIYSEHNILQLHNYFTNKTFQFHNGSYRNLLNQLTSDMIVYIDPPYYPCDGKSGFVSYHKTGFSVDDQKQLCEDIKELDRHGIRFIMSNTPCPEIIELYKDFYQEIKHINRNMKSGKGKTRSNDEPNEILITNMKH